MKYLDLLGNEHKLNTSQHLEKKENKSQLHLKTRNFLKSVFPLFTILEECPIKVRPKTTLYLDFFIPQLNYLFEMHGEQHVKYIPFFFKTKSKFLLAQNNDRLKREWAILNNFTLYEFYWNETEEDWRNKICGNK